MTGVLIVMGMVLIGVAVAPVRSDWLPQVLVLAVLVALVSSLMAYVGFLLGLRHRSQHVAEPRQSPTLDLSEVVPLLERIAVALENGAIAAPAAVTVASPAVVLAEVRHAIAERAWDRIDALLIEHAEHPERATIVEELARARQDAAVELKAELVAAREANDPERVLLLYDDLVKLIGTDDAQSLQQESVRWFVKLIMRRMRTGTVRADVAELSSKVADRFAMTVEGASLRASLPTLRRSAGLCPRCGQPYRGFGDACPQCVATAVPANSVAPAADEEADAGEEESPPGS